MEKITLPQVRDIGQIIGDPFLFVRANFKFLFKAFLYYAVPPLIVAVGLSAFGFKSLMGGIKTYGAGGYRGFSSLGPMILLAYGVFILTSMFQHLYVSEYLVLKEENEDVTNAEVLSKLKTDWKIILISYLVMIPIGIAVIAVVFLLIASASVLGTWASGLMIAVFYVFILYSIIPLQNFLFIRVRERLGIIDSLAKCFRITSGHWWRTFVAYFVLLTIFYMLMICMIMPLGIINAIVSLHSTPADLASQVAFIKIIGGIAITIGSFAFFFIMNLVNVFAGINYFSLSEQYDSYHLKTEINEIGVREDRTVHRQEGEY